MSNIEHIKSLFERFTQVKEETDTYLQKLYEREGFEDIELAILFQTLSHQHLMQSLKENAGLDDEHLKILENQILTEYEKENHEAILNQVIKFSRLSGITLSTLELIMNRMR